MSQSPRESSGSPDPDHTTKRKRTAEPQEELEIDVNLPEPPSKKAKRKEKKSKDKKKKGGDEEVDATIKTTKDDAEAKTTNKPATAYGIWIGNLPFSATKESLKTFFEEQGDIAESDITRVHMPAPTEKHHGPIKPQNKGFAYVDFATTDAQKAAIELSEKLLVGRRVLIKDAKSFVGRPTVQQTPGSENKAGGAASIVSAKPPSKRVFVGNLSYDVTRDELREHFEQAGEVEDVFMATFEDSGKSKGFAWVRFAEIESAEAAMKGFILREAEQDNGVLEDEQKLAVEAQAAADGSGSESEDKDTATVKAAPRPSKRKKWFINRLQGRQLRVEYAEDAQTRYKKRFHKDPPAHGTGEVPGDGEQKTVRAKRPPGDAEDRRAARRARHEDARNVAPGRALSSAQRGKPAAIVAGQGKKISFD